MNQTSPRFTASLPTSMSSDQVSRRYAVLARHLSTGGSSLPASLDAWPCLQITPPEAFEDVHFDVAEMRRILDGHNNDDRDWHFRIMEESNLFRSKRRSDGRVFVFPDYAQSMEQQREVTMRRVFHLLGKGVFKGWLTRGNVEATMRRLALFEGIGVYDHSLGIKIGVHFPLM